MARVARRASQVVVVVNVTIRALAWRHGVRSRQSESSAVVIECCIQPCAGAVALVAARREVRSHVIRIRSSLVVRLVARVARRARQVVVIVLVAIAALPRRHGVHAGQRKAGCRVIELAITPLHRVMTLFASRGESRMCHRTRSVVVVVLVAAHARRAGDAVVVIDMAIRALSWRYRMRARQREP